MQYSDSGYYSAGGRDREKTPPLGKIFVGGLSWDTATDHMREYFSKFGEVLDAVIMRDKFSGRSRGFGFVTFADPLVIDKVMDQAHSIDGRNVELKRAVSREEMEKFHMQSTAMIPNFKTKKIFVGGLPIGVTEDEMRNYFEKFGKVTEVLVMVDRATGRQRGFGFVVYDAEDTVEKVLRQPHEIQGKPLDLRKAEPKRPMGMWGAPPPPMSGYGYGPMGPGMGRYGMPYGMMGGYGGYGYPPYPGYGGGYGGSSRDGGYPPSAYSHHHHQQPASPTGGYGGYPPPPSSGGYGSRAGRADRAYHPYAR